MAFINGIWVEQPNNANVLDKITLTPNNIALSSVSSREARGRYLLIFSISYFGSGLNFNDPVVWGKVDKKSVLPAILGNFDKNEIQYYNMTLKGSNQLKCYFNHEKWFNDALKGVKPRKNVNMFRKEFNLKKRLPKLLTYLNGRDYFASFLAEKFRQHLNDRKYQKFFKGIIPKEYERHIRKKLSSMMEYEYDIRRNVMLSKLKPVYILGILYAVNKLNDKVDKKSYFIKVGKDRDFTKRVKGKSTNFDKRKWKEFIKKRYI